MKIALSSSGRDINSNISEVFGRCPYFLIVEIEDNKIKELKAIKNTSANQAGGAGISVAQMVAEKKVSAVIAGAVGPKALEVLKQFDIRVYRSTGLVKEVIQKFIERKLEETQ